MTIEQANHPRDVVFLNDLDGVHYVGPPPAGTLVSLVRKTFAVPQSQSTLEQYVESEHWLGKLSDRFTLFYHQVRGQKEEALRGLAVFKGIAEEYERQITFAASSGRHKPLHDMTKNRLQQTGRMDYFSTLYLNETKSASAWKEHVARRLVNEGKNVIHIDDDLKAGLRVARIQEEFPEEQRVLVYILRNISNHPQLLKRGKVPIPTNVVFVNSFAEAALDFAHRLYAGEL